MSNLAEVGMDIPHFVAESPKQILSAPWVFRELENLQNGLQTSVQFRPKAQAHQVPILLDN